MRQPLGAINKKTGKYVYPQIANKKNEYICPDCNKDLIFCHGKIKVPYFRHSADNNPCNYHDKPNESQIHKDAKMLMKRFLDDKTKITFRRKCDSCQNEECFDIGEMTDKPHLHKENKKELVHGLLRCQSVKHKSEIIHNRDKNAVQNMLNIVEHVFKNGKRPTEYQRT
jgi:C4-type Zn-finger protein